MGGLFYEEGGAWFNSGGLSLAQFRGLCLAQIRGFVPGTHSAICTWYMACDLYLVHHTRFVPGTIPYLIILPNYSKGLSGFFPDVLLRCHFNRFTHDFHHLRKLLFTRCKRRHEDDCVPDRTCKHAKFPHFEGGMVPNPVFP